MMFKWIADMWKDEIIEQKPKFDLKKAKTDHINMVFGNCKHGIKLGLCLICCRDKEQLTCDCKDYGATGIKCQLFNASICRLRIKQGYVFDKHNWKLVEKETSKMTNYFGKDRQYWIDLISIKDKLSLIEAACKFENIVIWNYTKLLNYENKEPNKMTREEAVRKIVKDKCYSDEIAIRLVDSLEVLGLIKFDEVKEPSPHSIISKNSHCPNQILAELEYWGYKIVKIDGTKA